VTVSAADPANLAGIVLPGERVPAIPGKQILYRNGVVYSEKESVESISPEVIQPVAAASPASLPMF
jgi:ATP-dependent Lhr-like helicase